MNKQMVHNFKPVIKAKDMDDDMFKEVERFARDSFDTKEKFKDEMVWL